MQPVPLAIATRPKLFNPTRSSREIQDEQVFSLLLKRAVSAKVSRHLPRFPTTVSLGPYAPSPGHDVDIFSPRCPKRGHRAAPAASLWHRAVAGQH